MRYRSKFVVSATYVLMAALASCSLPLSPTAAPSPTGAASVNASAPTSSKAQILVHITTTSDWTKLRLVRGGTWVNPMNVSSSPEATAATIQGNLINLSQPPARAQAGQEIEMSLDVFFSDLIPNDEVVFDIQRGFIGSTQVELSAYTGGQPRLLKTFTWGETNQANGNIVEVQILGADILTPPTALLTLPTAIPGPNEYIVIAQLNLWYFGAGCNGGFEAYDCSGKRTTPLIPALGYTYTSSDPSVIRQQIDWAADYGVDAFSMEWTTPRGVGTSGSLEDNIDDAFLRAPNLDRIRWCIFYDTALRIMQDPTLSFANGTDFDDPGIYNAFVSDFDHLAEKYFGQPQYLRIDGRPVINIYVSWQFKGNYQGAIRDARAKAAARGFDVYIVGEEMRADRILPDHIKYFDATTSFNFATPGVPDQPDMGKEAVVLDQFWKVWREKTKDIKVFGRDEMVGLQPSFGPQEDSRLFAPPSNQIYVPALSKDQVIAMAEVARDNAVPAGSLNQKFLWVNTWNNWAEAATIEPTILQGPKYPAGNYGFDFLEVMREVFGPKTFSN